ncbi:ARM repeat-containing protein, partial [Neocallimastix californiae]
MLGTTQAKPAFQRSPLLTHKPKSSSINYIELSPKAKVFSPGHRRGASLNVVVKKLDKSLLNGGIALDKNEKEDDEDSKISLTLNTSVSSFTNEVIVSPELDNLPELHQLENDEETLVESPTTLYVEYLDHSLSTKELKPYFAKFGEIESLKIDNDKDVAYIKYKNSKDASKAKNEMNGKMIKTSEIQISFHSSPEVNSNEEALETTPTKSLWIGNIPASLSPSDLEKKFANFGSIESARLLSHKTCGFINFENLDDAIQAKEKMNGLEINGTAIKVSYAKVPPKSESHDSDSVKSPSSPSSEKSNKEGKKKSEKVKKDLPHLTIPITTEFLKSSDDDNEQGEYFDTIPTLSDHLTKRQVDQNKLKEMRKKLEGHTTAKEIESYFNTIMLDVVGLCTDYIGNVIVQKVLDRTSDENRLKLIEKLSPHLATVGIHKNGTWVVQKIIDEAKGPVQIQYIVDGLKKYTPPLLLDQFGNYVIQCCLRLGTQNNQFIFDAIVAKCKDIGPGRFGARAIRACLESQHTTKRQQKQVAMSIVRCATDLCVNPNGALLITWLLDTSSLPGRFRVIAPKLVPNIASFCCNKLASSTILKLVNQRVEMDARSTIIKSIFYQSDAILQEILSNPAYGVSVIQKILASACINNEEKIQLADRV